MESTTLMIPKDASTTSSAATSSFTTAKVTSSSNTQSTINLTSEETAKEDETTGTPYIDTTPFTSPPDDIKKYHTEKDSNEVPTTPSDSDISYILNILDLTNVSKEYKSRKNIQSSLQSK